MLGLPVLVLDGEKKISTTSTAVLFFVSQGQATMFLLCQKNVKTPYTLGWPRDEPTRAARR